MNDWLRQSLVCPRDHASLIPQGDKALVCPHGHSYPIYDGIPVFIRDDVEQTAWWSLRSLEKARAKAEVPKREAPAAAPDEIDPHVQGIVASTCGHLYAPLVGRLKRYPIPELRLPDGGGQLFLDLGCNWGRWCVAAGRRGYQAVGVDPSLDAVLAARRVARQLGVDALFVVADARFLPFRSNTFDVVFSYSVLQHFSRADARTAFHDAGRVLKPGGLALIQMPNKFGLRCLYHQIKRGFAEGQNFDVRYWTIPELREAFERAIGETDFSVDGFFGLGIQKNDLDMLPFRYKLIVQSSELLRSISRAFGPMKHLADSVYVHARRRKELPPRVGDID